MQFCMAFFNAFRGRYSGLPPPTFGTKRHYSNYEEYSVIPQSVTLFVSAYISLTKTYKFHFPHFGNYKGLQTYRLYLLLFMYLKRDKI